MTSNPASSTAIPRAEGSDNFCRIEWIPDPYIQKNSKKILKFVRRVINE